MNLGDRYRQLCLLGRDTFLDSVAEAALVIQQRRPRMARGTTDPRSPAKLDEPLGVDTAIQEASAPAALPIDFRPKLMRPVVFPLAKKLGTPFVDLITVGRTSNNDVTMADLSVSRFQAFFRHRFGRWYLCDAGSRNGTRVNAMLIKARTEIEVVSGDSVQFGLLETTFHTADTLYDVLASRQTRF